MMIKNKVRLNKGVLCMQNAFSIVEKLLRMTKEKGKNEAENVKHTSYTRISW